MTPARWARIKELFDAALTRPEIERDAFLEDVCGSDHALRQELQELIREARGATVQSPVAGLLARTWLGELGPDRTIGHYLIEHELGSGGMGIVCRAFDTQLRRPVALKILPPELRSSPDRRERFLREARAASVLSHPNIISIFEVGSDRGLDFIAMEFIEGQTLDRVIPPAGLPVPLAVGYAVQVASALAQAHTAGVIHRDIKPANIMVTSSGSVKVLDFGLAHRSPQNDAPDSSLTCPGQILGTPAYMSPEQARGEAADAWFDIFSFGAVLYEMLTGRRAFGGNAAVGTMAAALLAEPALPPNVPPELVRLVGRCLCNDPARRWQRMEDIRAALQDCREKTSRRVRLTPRRRARPILAIGLALLLAVAALVVWRLVAKSRGAPPMRVMSLTSYPGAETTPAFSPDGNQAAFSWNGGLPGNFDIYVTVTGSGAPPLRLTTEPSVDTDPAWSPDGRRIAFIRLGRPRASVCLISPLGGPERTLVDFRAPPVGFTGISWTPDGEWLAVPDQDAAPPGIFLVSAATGEKHRLTCNLLDRDISPAVSPNGSLLAYASCSDTWSCDVYLLDLAAGYLPLRPPRRLTRQGAYLDGIAWTADGGWLVYGASLDAGVSRHLWRVAASGSGPPERLEIAGLQASFPACARSARRLAYSHGGGELGLWKFETGAGLRSLAPSTLSEFNPVFSPDGRKIAFSSNRSGSLAIWLCDREGSNLVKLTEGAGRWQGGPQWSPDGRQIAFSAPDEKGTFAIYVMDSAGGRIRRVTPPDAGASTVSWSRDGNWLYYAANHTGRLELWRIASSGGESTQVTDSGGFMAFESWDGKTLYYTKTRNAGLTPIYARALPGGAERMAFAAAVNDAFAVTGDGIYYFTQASEGGFALQFVETATGRVRTMTTVDVVPAWRLTVSPDGRTVVFGARKPANSDLMWIEDFR
jgi:Tol biopolymer transport system component